MFFDWSFLTSWLGSAVQGLLSVVVQVFQFLFNLIRAAFILLWNALTAVLGFVLNMLGKLLNVLRPLWTHVLRPALQKLLDFYRWLRLKLATILGPVIRLLQKIKRWFDLHIFPVMKRYIDLIQHIRRTLVILRIFNVEWAKKLDEKLARDQARITRAFQMVRGRLNQVIDLVNLAQDPAGFLELFPLGRTILVGLDSLLKAVTGHGLGLYLGGPHFGAPFALPSGSFSQITDAMMEDVKTGTGEFAEVSRQVSNTWADLDQELK